MKPRNEQVPNRAYAVLDTCPSEKPMPGRRRKPENLNTCTTVLSWWPVTAHRPAQGTVFVENLPESRRKRTGMSCSETFLSTIIQECHARWNSFLCILVGSLILTYAPAGFLSADVLFHFSSRRRKTPSGPSVAASAVAARPAACKQAFCLRFFLSPVGTSESTTAVKVKGLRPLLRRTLTHRGDPLQGRPAGPNLFPIPLAGEPTSGTFQEI